MRGYEALVDAMANDPGREFTLHEIYKLVCDPVLKNPSIEQLHSRCSRPIGQAREALKRRGYVMVKGKLRHSYRAERRRRTA